MSWLIEEEPDQEQLAAEWRQLVEAGPIVQIPGTHDGMAARIAKQADFQALYLIRSRLYSQQRIARSGPDLLQRGCRTS